jgi:hypothetical protein
MDTSKLKQIWSNYRQQLHRICMVNDKLNLKMLSDIIMVGMQSDLCGILDIYYLTLLEI